MVVLRRLVQGFTTPALLDVALKTASFEAKLSGVRLGFDNAEVSKFLLHNHPKQNGLQIK
jgi:hypothetical protein